MLPFDRGLLLEMLTYARPAGTETEREFIARYIAVLPNAEQDQFLNWHVCVGDSPVLWSCHTDTVHYASGRQTVRYDPQTGMVRLSRRSRRGKRGSSCLGADDTVGVALCHQMILAGVPGHYVFHYGEEIGGEGSGDLSRIQPDLVSGSLFAIALDRQGYGDVVTSQYGGRCCSDLFADGLADLLNASGLDLAYAKHRGVFTDTANYVDAIGECTNLSVGYFDQHTKHESVNVHFVSKLFDALCRLDQSALISSRKPGEEDVQAYGKWRICTAGTSSVSSIVANDRTFFTEDCEYCGRAFDPSQSSAEDCDRYCSADCETLDLDSISRCLTGTSTYLDPAFEDVQNALRDAIRRSRNGR